MITRHIRQNAVAYLALLVAVSTGTAYAADQIADGSVTSKKLAKDAVTSAKIKKNAVKSADIKDGQVSGTDVQDGALTSTDLASGAVDSRGVADGSIVAADLAPGTIPAGFASTEMPGGPTPSTNPDSVLEDTTFTLPRAGKIYVRAFTPLYGVDCPSALGVVALYLDGAPVPGSGTNAPSVSQGRALESVGVVTATAGSHTLSMRNDCTNGNQTSSVSSEETFTVLSVE